MFLHLISTFPGDHLFQSFDKQVVHTSLGRLLPALYPCPTHHAQHGLAKYLLPPALQKMSVDVSTEDMAYACLTETMVQVILGNREHALADRKRVAFKLRFVAACHSAHLA